MLNDEELLGGEFFADENEHEEESEQVSDSAPVVPTNNGLMTTQAETLAQILAAVTSLGARISAIEGSDRTSFGGAFTTARSSPATPTRQANVTVRRSSRNSMGPTTPTTTLVATQTLVSEYVIPEKHMLRMPEPKNKDEKPELPLKLVSWLYDNYNYYKDTSTDKTKTLIMFIHKSLVKDMILNEIALDSSLRLMDETKVYKCKDEETSVMLCNLIRPKSRNEYLTKYAKAVRKPDFSNMKTFNVENWHRYIHPEFIRTLEDAVKYDEYMRRHAKPEELEVMPTHTWGKKSGPKQGLFRIILEFFQPYNEIILNDIGEDNLKSITDIKVFVEKLTELNSKYCAASLNFMRMNQRLQEPLKTAELIRESKTRTMQEKFRKGSDEKRDRHSRIPSFKRLDGDVALKEAEDDYVSDFCVMMGAGYSKDPKRGIPRGAAPRASGTGDVKRLTCYTYAQYGKCEAGSSCVYSHDSKDCKAYLKRELRKILFSPNYEDTIMIEARREGKIESKPKQDKSSGHKSNHKTYSRGDNKQLDAPSQSEVQPEKKLKQAGDVSSDSEDSISTTKSGSSTASDRSKRSGSDNGESDNA